LSLSKAELQNLIGKFEAHSSLLNPRGAHGNQNNENNLEVVNIARFREMQGILGKYYLTECLFQVILKLRSKLGTNSEENIRKLGDR
jgi:hypothetical protein